MNYTFIYDVKCLLSVCNVCVLEPGVDYVVGAAVSTVTLKMSQRQQQLFLACHVSQAS